MAPVLLLAALAQPAWAIAHAVIHDHLANDVHHLGADHGHSHIAVRRPEPQNATAPQIAGGGHRHDHGHFEATFLRTSSSVDWQLFAAIPAAEPHRVALALQRRGAREGAQASRTSPPPPDASRPRAPPHA